MDVFYLSINDILEYNPSYVQTDFTYNLGLTIKFKNIPFMYFIKFCPNLRLKMIQ